VSVTPVLVLFTSSPAFVDEEEDAGIVILLKYLRSFSTELADAPVAALAADEVVAFAVGAAAVVEVRARDAFKFSKWLNKQQQKNKLNKEIN
jgi:hypothetical protein